VRTPTRRSSGTGTDNFQASLAGSHHACRVSRSCNTCNDEISKTHLIHASLSFSTLRFSCLSPMDAKMAGAQVTQVRLVAVLGQRQRSSSAFDKSRVERDRQDRRDCNGSGRRRKTKEGKGKKDRTWLSHRVQWEHDASIN